MAVVNKVITAALLFTILIAHPAMASDSDNDVNNDVGAAKLFSSLDMDNDGTIDKQEHLVASMLSQSGDLDLGLSENQMKRLSVYDDNKDGSFDEDELSHLFDRLDEDGDGAVTFEELARRMANPAKEHP